MLFPSRGNDQNSPANWLTSSEWRLHRLLRNDFSFLGEAIETRLHKPSDGNHMQFIPSFCVRMVSSCRINMITMPAKMIRRSCGVSMAFHRNYHQSGRDETPLKPPKQGSKSLKAQETRSQQSWWGDIHVCIYYIYIYVRTCYIYMYVYIYIYIPCPTLPLEFSSDDMPCFNNPRWSQQPFSCCSPSSARQQTSSWKHGIS